MVNDAFSLIIDWSLILFILILVLFPCSLSSDAKSSPIKVLRLPVSRRACFFPLTSWTRYEHRNNLEIKFMAFMCWHMNCYIWISQMLFCRCFLKGIMQSSVIILWTILLETIVWWFARLCSRLSWSSWSMGYSPLPNLISLLGPKTCTYWIWRNCQGFIQALLLTSVFHKGLGFMAVGHNPTCVSTMTLAARILKVMSTTFLLVCFLCLKESTCETRKNVFYLNSKALFILEKTFQIFKCHDVINCLSMKHETHIIE